VLIPTQVGVDFPGFPLPAGGTTPAPQAGQAMAMPRHGPRTCECQDGRKPIGNCFYGVYWLLGIAVLAVRDPGLRA